MNFIEDCEDAMGGVFVCSWVASTLTLFIVFNIFHLGKDIAQNFFLAAMPSVVVSLILCTVGMIIFPHLPNILYEVSEVSNSKGYTYMDNFIRDCKDNEIRVYNNEPFSCSYCLTESNLVVAKGKSRTCIYCQYITDDIYVDKDITYWEDLLINRYGGMVRDENLARKLGKIMNIIKTENRSPEIWEI